MKSRCSLLFLLANLALPASAFRAVVPSTSTRSMAFKREMAIDASIVESVSETISTALTSPEPIHSAFSVATFFPQPFWVLMIILPKSPLTKKIMGGLGKWKELVWPKTVYNRNKQLIHSP